MVQEVVIVDKLLKTRSGKIMRRVLKAQELGEEVGDLSAMGQDWNAGGLFNSSLSPRTSPPCRAACCA